MPETRHITGESDAHGELCAWCVEHLCVANVYVVDANGDLDVEPCCAACVDTVIEHRHTSDSREPLVEISTAPLPAPAAC